MLPLIGLATSIMPALIRLVASDKAGTLAAQINRVVTELTGTDDPVAAREKLVTDAAAQAGLQQRLAELALEASRAEIAAAEQTRRDELAAIKAAGVLSADPRGAMQALASARSPAAWGAPVVSAVVTVGFFVVLALLVINGLHVADDKTADIINIAVGVLGTGFATVVNFWLGSSSSARNKDVQVLALQAEHATQAATLLKTLQSAHDLHTESTRSALAAVQNVVSTAVGGGRPTCPAAAVAATESQQAVSVDVAQ